MKKILAVVLALCCLCLAGCHDGDGGLTDAPRSTNPIKDIPQTEPPEELKPTPVYATVFGDTVLLADYPITIWGENMDGREGPDCGPTLLTDGAQIACGGEHETETPITKVIVVVPIRPTNTSNWFRGLTHLQEIQQLELLDTTFVTDMTDMFADCPYYPLPDWYLAETEE